MTSDNTAAQQNLLSKVGDLLPNEDPAAAVLERVDETPLGGAVDQLNPLAEAPAPDARPFEAQASDAPAFEAQDSTQQTAPAQPAAPEGIAPADFIDEPQTPATPAWAAAVVNGAGGRPDVSGLDTTAPAFPELNLEPPPAAAAGITGAAAVAGIAGFASPPSSRGPAPTAHGLDLSNHSVPDVAAAAPPIAPPSAAAPLPTPATTPVTAPPQMQPTAYAPPPTPNFPLPESGPAFPAAVQPQTTMPQFNSAEPGYPDSALDASFGAPPTPTVGQVPGAPPTADAALAAPQTQDLSSLGMQSAPVGFADAESHGLGVNESVPASVAYSTLDEPSADFRDADVDAPKAGLSRILKMAALAVGALILGLLALRLLGVIGGGDDKSVNPTDEQGGAAASTSTTVEPTTNTTVADAATNPSTPTTAAAAATTPIAGADYLAEQFVDPNGRFQVGLPAQPEASQQPRTLGTTELQADIFTSTGLDGHEIHVIDYPAEIDPSSYSLDALVADLVERFSTIGISTSVESPTMVDGYPARQIEFKNEEAVWIGFVTAKDQTSYLAMTKTTPENRAVHQQMVDSWVFTN